MASKLVLVSLLRSMLTFAFVCSALLSSRIALALPLSTSSHWIIDEETGSIVKLACVNWAFHSTPMLAEGLHLHPLESIARGAIKSGFNCVKLSWGACMFTNRTLANRSVAQTLKGFELEEELEGVARFNGKLVRMTIVEAFKEVVLALSKERLMVILDNRYGDECVSAGDEEVWFRGLKIVASLFKGWPSVVGVTVRYNLSHSNEVWRMQRGAEVINSQNPDLLIIHGGLRNGEDLRSLMTTPLWEKIRRKVVYEVHISIGKSVVGQCDAMMRSMWRIIHHYTAIYTGPLLIGELELDNGQSVSENGTCFMPCLSAFAAQYDMASALWNLKGFDYMRQGVEDNHQTVEWVAPHKVPQLHNSEALQEKLFIQDTKRRPPKILFHPATGLCVNKVNVNGLEMGSCKEASSWKFLPQGLIVLESSYLVIGAEGPNQAAVLELQGTQANGPWTLVVDNLSTQHVQVSTTLAGQALCLDSPAPPILLTNPCTCLDTPPSGRFTQHCEDSPISQWFIPLSSSHH